MDRKDKYYIKAKREKYRSRAAFKLIEIEEKYNIINKNDYVLEFGASPGGWTQIIKEYTDMPVVSVDLSKMVPIDNVIFIQGNINDVSLHGKINEIMASNNIKLFNAIVSDAMVKTSDNGERDHYQSYQLCENVMELSIDLLSKNGNMLLKQFQGDMTDEFLNKWKSKFGFYKITKPHASRPHSKEIYILFKNKR